MNHPYKVTGFAIGDDGTSAYLGAVTVSAQDDNDARKLAMDLLWDSRLDSASCTPNFIVVRMPVPAMIERQSIEDTHKI